MIPGVTQLIMSDKPTLVFLDAARDAGYGVVELGMSANGEVGPSRTEQELRDISKAAQDRGLAIASLVHGQCSASMLGSATEATAAVEQTLAGLRVAHTMGVTCTLHTLGRQRPAVPYDLAYASVVRSLKQVAGSCESLGVDVAVEFVWNGFAFSPLEMRRLLEEVGSARIGFYFDPGNMAVFQRPEHWVRILGQHIRMVHLKDWKGSALNGGWPALLKGDVDFPAVMRELRTIGYDGPLISEVSLDEASLEETCNSIKAIMNM